MKLRPRLVIWCFLFFGLLLLSAQEPAAPVRIDVILWFDTEDYILPASDDAALRLADWLTTQGIRATFKVVGEKARTLERRGRTDVIAALKKHEIGYHSNWHSVPPTPAQYLNECGWEDGIAEFTRREKPGFDDVARIFGQSPTCYGQPGSSWAPQTHAAIHQWGVRVYLDAGQHVNVDGRPFWYGGLLNFYKLTHQIRVGLGRAEDVEEAKTRFLHAREQLIADKGGVVSIVYHPCEFVHQQFWDAVNFKNGDDPPRDQWKLPHVKTDEESKLAYQNFEQYISFLRRFPEVRFVTATEAAHDYPDRARAREYTRDDVSRIAAQLLLVTKQHGINWATFENVVLSPAETFCLFTHVLATWEDAASRQQRFSLPEYLSGPAQASKKSRIAADVPVEELKRASKDVLDYLQKKKRVPNVVWIGSRGVGPEEYYGLALRTISNRTPMTAPVPKDTVWPKDLRLKAQDAVADDGPHLWKWVIFPEGFRAPQVMAYAKLQAWTLKPALYQPQPR